MTLLAVMVALAALSFVILNKVVVPAFDRLEIDDAQRNLIRAERAIRNDLENLSAITGDWGLWDDAYDYVRGEYPAFQDSNLDRPTLTNLNLNLLLIYDADASLLWGDAARGEESLDLDAFGVFAVGSGTADVLIRHDDVAGNTSGLLRTNLGPMLFSSWPVTTSDGAGPIAGSMIMGQFLDQAHMQRLRDRTEVMLGWRLIDDRAAATGQLPLPLNSKAPGTMRHETTDDAITSYGMLTDLFDEPLIVLDVVTPRQISALGRQTVNGALLFLAGAGIVVAAVAWMLLRKRIVDPLTALTAHITAIRESGDLSQRMNVSREDEIGFLGSQFDKLTEEVHDARMLLLDQSFKAGKADAAAEVMHNIRNAMTPLVNGLDRVAKKIRAADSRRVAQAVEELGDDGCPVDRRQKLLMYVDSTFAHIKGTREDALEDLAVATRQARQVEMILSDQEKHAKVAPIIEDFNLGNLIEEAVLVLPSTDDDGVELNVESEVNGFRVRGHRVGVLQVLGNVILNAYESIERSKTHAGSIGLSATAETVEDTPMIRLTVRDTGCGFDDRTSEKIFQRGFSSKEGHLSGLGLHWCANALAGMGGRIQAESDGPGRGAEFHVLLPAAQGG